METANWLGFENEEHEGGARASYEDWVEQDQLKPNDEKEHSEYVRRVAEEFGFPIPDWQPVIPSRSLI